MGRPCCFSRWSIRAAASVKTVTFYSYKGDMGRTLLLANVAKYLSRFGQKVFTLDFDLEAPGLHYKLAPAGGWSNQTPRPGVVRDYIRLIARLVPSNMRAPYILPLVQPGYREYLA